jgi:hypothetical protein
MHSFGVWLVGLPGPGASLCTFAAVHQLHAPTKPLLQWRPQDGRLEVRDLGGGRCANLVRYRVVGCAPPAAELKAAHRVLKRVARVSAPAAVRRAASAVEKH